MLAWKYFPELWIISPFPHTSYPFLFPISEFELWVLVSLLGTEARLWDTKETHLQHPPLNLSWPLGMGLMVGWFLDWSFLSFLRWVTVSSNTSAFVNLAMDSGCRVFAMRFLSSSKHLLTLARVLRAQAISQTFCISLLFGCCITVSSQSIKRRAVWWWWWEVHLATSGAADACCYC